MTRALFVAHKNQSEATSKGNAKSPVNSDAHVFTCTNNALKCIYTNADGLNNKMAELSILIKETSPDLVLVTEAFNKTSSIEPRKNEFMLQDYDIIWNGEVTGKKRRGICVYAKDKLNIIPVECENPSEEEIWIKFKTPHHTWTVGCIYRSPNTSDETPCYYHQSQHNQKQQTSSLS